MKQSPIPLTRKQKERYKYLGEVGKVVSFTSIAIAPRGLEKQAPYVVAVVDFGEERAILPLAEVRLSEVEMKMEVIGVLRRMYEPDNSGVIAYGVKCIPIANE